MYSDSDGTTKASAELYSIDCSTPNGKSMAAVPLFDENGDAILFDIYIDGVWHGSRRTLEHCESYFKFIGMSGASLK